MTGQLIARAGTSAEAPPSIPTSDHALDPVLRLGKLDDSLSQERQPFGQLPLVEIRRAVDSLTESTLS